MYPDQAGDVWGDPQQWLDPLDFYSPTSDFSVLGLWRDPRVADYKSCSTSFWLLLYFGHWICIKTRLQPHTGGNMAEVFHLSAFPTLADGKKVLRNGLALLYHVVNSWLYSELVRSCVFCQPPSLIDTSSALVTSHCCYCPLWKKMRVVWSFQETDFTFSWKLRGMMCQRATGRCQNCDCVLVHAAVFHMSSNRHSNSWRPLFRPIQMFCSGWTTTSSEL